MACVVMNLCLARVVLGIGIAWATTVIRREVGTRDELQAPLDMEDKSSIHKAVHFSVGGHMMTFRDHHNVARSVEEDTNSNFEYKDIEMCDDDFPVGPANSDSCEHTADVEIDQPDMCREAARQANATIDENTFSVDIAYQQLRPRGCLKWNCPGSTTNVCYYYNPWDTPSTRPIEGEKVCVRVLQKNGTLDANEATGVSCPSGYQHVIKENICRLAAGCQGAYAGDPFVITPANRDKYPAGCFMNAATGGYFFNPLYNINGTRLANPTNAVGYPLCNVSEQTNWGASR